MGLGLGRFLEKRLAPSPEKRLENERKKNLEKRMQEERWKGYEKRKLAEAKTQHPSRAVRVFDTLGVIGERSRSVAAGVSGGVEVAPFGGYGGKGGFGFEVADPLAFPSEKARKRKPKFKRRSREIHIHIDERGRDRRRR